MKSSKSGQRFIDPPAYMFRRRPLIDPGLLALIGAIIAIAFLTLMLGILEANLGFRLGDWFSR